MQKSLTKKTTFLVLIGLLLLSLASTAFAADWYNTDWSYRQQITSSSTMTDTDQTEFPVLIKITDPANPVFDKALSNGDDILFTSSDGITKLTHEIEKYNNTVGSEELIAWVKVPVLSSTTDTNIYIYYGNSSAFNQENPQGVWDSSHVGVWHLKEDQAGTGNLDLYQDTTTNNNGDDYVSATGQQGQINSGQELDGADDYIDAGNNTNLDITDTITISAWVNLKSTSGARGIVVKGAAKYAFYFPSDSAVPKVRLDGLSPTKTLSFGSAINLNQWTHLSFTYDSNGGTDNLKTYINGNLSSTDTKTGAILTDTLNLMIGSDRGIQTFFNGFIDELRISSTTRSAEWIKASYNNQNNPAAYLDFAVEEGSPSSPPTATTDPAIDINGNAATLNATVNPNGSETTVYFEWGTDTSYGNSTSSQSIGSGTGNVSVSDNITGLSLETTYHYRVVATNDNGTTYTYGDDMSFTTTGGTYVSGTISTDTTWTYAGSPYIVTGNIYVYGDPEPTLSIEPGVEVRFDGAYYLKIGYTSYSAILKAQGTATSPIIFTSNKAIPAPGDWEGIRFYNHASTESILEYVTVEYGGGGYATNCNICVINNSPTIKNSIIRNSSYYGIYSTGDSSITIMFSTITNNVNYAVYSSSSVLKINHSNITGNGNGIYSPTGQIADARLNWWGDATGPSGEGPGTGQSVTGVTFEPWLGTAYTYPFYNIDLHATLQGFSPLNNSVKYTFSISENANWVFSINDSIGTTVRTFTGSGIEGTVTWDGKDGDDGTYTYQLSSTSLSNSSQSAPLIGDVVIEEALPKAEITFPVDGQLVGNSPLDIQGSADDSDFKDYKLEYGFGTTPTSWTLITSSTTPVNESSLGTWNPSNLTGAYYSIRLAVNDNAGNTATASVEVKFLTITNLAVSNPYFSPDEDSSKDTTTITASITYSSDWTVDIKNSGNEVVRTLNGTGTPISATWDGKNTLGDIQPEGIYSYTITATEPSSGAVAIKDSTSNITIDLTLPIAEITDPVANQEVYETVTITGTASDAVAKDYHSLYYGVGTNPGTYTQFYSETANVTDGTLGTWNTHDLDNGIYTIKLLVMDKAGNSTETTVPVNVLNARVSNLTASVSFDPPSNQASAISYNLANGGLITIRIGTYAAYFRTLIQDAKRPAGENTDYWDGRNDLGELVPAGTYIIAIYSTTDPAPMPETAPRITDPLSTPARFDPTTDPGATISYNLSKGATVTIGIYDFDDNLIRSVVTDVSQSLGSNSVIWDGKNEDGNYVYPAAYRFKIIATGSDSVTGPEVTGITQVYY